MLKRRNALLDCLKAEGVRLQSVGAGQLLVVLIGGLVLFTVGCSKKGQGATPPPGQPSAAPQVNQPVTNLAQPNGAVDLSELDRCVIRWVVANRRRPNSFDDFAATAGVHIPPPPPGKKYIFTQDLHVQLVDR